MMRMDDFVAALFAVAAAVDDADGFVAASFAVAAAVDDVVGISLATVAPAAARHHSCSMGRHQLLLTNWLSQRRQLAAPAEAFSTAHRQPPQAVMAAMHKGA